MPPAPRRWTRDPGHAACTACRCWRRRSIRSSQLSPCAAARAGRRERPEARQCRDRRRSRTSTAIPTSPRRRRRAKPAMRPNSVLAAAAASSARAAGSGARAAKLHDRPLRAAGLAERARRHVRSPRVGRRRDARAVRDASARRQGRGDAGRPQGARREIGFHPLSARRCAVIPRADARARRHLRRRSHGAR